MPAEKSPNFRRTRRNVIAMGGILASMAVAATVGAATKAHAGFWGNFFGRRGGFPGRRSGRGTGGDGCFLSGTNILTDAGATKIEKFLG